MKTYLSCSVGYEERTMKDSYFKTNDASIFARLHSEPLRLFLIILKISWRTFSKPSPRPLSGMHLAVFGGPGGSLTPTEYIMKTKLSNVDTSKKNQE